MDLNNVAGMLRGLNDQQLMQEMNHPSPGVPQFLILTEMQRRKALRASIAPKEPADVTPVSQELMQGVASTPQMSMSGPPVAMAGGGIVGYFGDRLDEMDQFVGDSQTKLKEWNAQRQRDADAKAAADRAKAEAKRTAVGPVLPAVAQPVGGIPAAGAAMDVKPPAPVPAVKPPSTPQNDMVSILQQELEQAVADGDVEYANSLKRELASAKANPPPPQSTALLAMQGSRRAATGPSRYAGGAGASAVPAAGSSGAVFGADGKMVVGDNPASDINVPDAPEPRQYTSIDDYLPGVEKALPQSNLDAVTGRIDQRLEDNRSRSKDTMNMALMQAGLAIMAGKSPHALQNIGEGGIAGLKAYTESQNNVNKERDALEMHRDAVEASKAAAKAGNYKQAADLMKDANNRITQENINDRTLYRDDLKDAQAQRNMVFQYDKLDAQQKMQYDRMDAQERAAFQRNLLLMKKAEQQAARQEKLGSPDMQAARALQEEAKASGQTLSLADALGQVHGLRQEPKSEDALMKAYTQLDIIEKRKYPTFESFKRAMGRGGDGPASPSAAGGTVIQRGGKLVFQP